MSKTKCSCGKQANYSRRFESHYCEICNIWLEKRCDDPDCKYCVNRPERPLNESHPPSVEGARGLERLALQSLQKVEEVPMT